MAARAVAVRLSPPGYARVRRWASKVLAYPRTPLILLGLLCVIGAGLRTYHLDTPKYSAPGQGYVFDERYYVSAARVIAGLPVHSVDTYAHASPSGTDPNGEHPQLGKMIVAGSLELFGDNAIGWRVTVVLFGVAALLLLYWLVRCAGGSPWLALGTAALGTFDNLWLVHSRIAVLDMYAVPFMLAGAGLYLRRRPVIAGVLVGIGACLKEFAVYTLFVLVLLELMRAVRWLWDRRVARRVANAAGDATAAGGDATVAGEDATAAGGATTVAGEDATAAGGDTTVAGGAATVAGGDATAAGGAATVAGGDATAAGGAAPAVPVATPGPGASVKRLLTLCAVSAVTFFTLLTVLDTLVTPYSGGHPVDRNQASICRYALIWKDGCNHFAFMNRYAAKLRDVGQPRGIAAAPTDFWLDRTAITYYKVQRTVSANGVVKSQQTLLWFRGEISRVILFTSWLAIALNLWWAIRRRDDLSFLVLAWVLGTWLPTELFHLIDQRTTYIYYMVVTTPGIYLAVARLLGARRFLWPLVVVWTGILLWDFASLYPLRTLSGS